MRPPSTISLPFGKLKLERLPKPGKIRRFVFISSDVTNFFDLGRFRIFFSQPRLSLFLQSWILRSASRRCINYLIPRTGFERVFVFTPERTSFVARSMTTGRDYAGAEIVPFANALLFHFFFFIGGTPPTGGSARRDPRRFSTPRFPLTVLWLVCVGSVLDSEFVLLCPSFLFFLLAESGVILAREIFVD